MYVSVEGCCLAMVFPVPKTFVFYLLVKRVYSRNKEYFVFKNKCVPQGIAMVICYFVLVFFPTQFM